MCAGRIKGDNLFEAVTDDICQRVAHVFKPVRVKGLFGEDGTLFQNLISAPLIIVSGRRVVMQRQSTGWIVSTPVDFDIAEVTIHEADHVFRIIKNGVRGRERLFWLMP